ncbi:sugar ABC transporter permease [Paenibacillus psychroresistens]|uniref:Sugar ABC transporter permease n=1 Tax=Paenibacillus psychroresistens TaxID=1778678 RepID=A0A6B8RET4_9BACL|nr:ABC transporter permease subunit [Paenibacillus psychroresistens]QGQ95001.1 sugar ABC transporter permease [Paenibacillus psychroresistens]
MEKAFANKSIVQRSKKKWIKNFKKSYFAYLLMLPSIVLTLIFSYFPMPGILVAFQDYNMFKGILHSPWVGMQHIIEIFQVPLLYNSIINTFILSVLTIIVGFPAPIILALMINEVGNGLFKRSVQTLTYLPHFLSWIAVVGLVYSFMDVDGPLNDLKLLLFGSDSGREMFLSKQSLFLPFLLLLSVWKEVGWGTIVFLAAITSIDPSLYEAARIDGANRFKQHLHITWPGMKITAVIMLIFTLGTLFGSNFELVYGMQNAYIDFPVISTVVYSSGIQQGNYSTAAAVGFVQGLVAFLLIIVANKISKKVSGISLW